jgi:hypothetical protein
MQTDSLGMGSSVDELPTDPPAIEITPTTLSSGMPQTKMAFISGEGPDEWIQSPANQPQALSIAMSTPDDPATIGTLVAGVQLDLAKEILHGVSDVTPQYGTGSAGLQLHATKPAGSPPSLSIEDSQRTPSGMIKPNGS